MIDLTQSKSGGVNVSAQVNEPLHITQTANKALRISAALVYYVNPWWTEFVTADGTFTLADDKTLKVLTE